MRRTTAHILHMVSAHQENYGRNSNIDVSTLRGLTWEKGEVFCFEPKLAS